jgi:hypothetical protein
MSRSVVREDGHYSFLCAHINCRALRSNFDIINEVFCSRHASALIPFDSSHPPFLLYTPLDVHFALTITGGPRM